MSRLVLFAVALLAAACGGDDDPGPTDQATEDQQSSDSDDNDPGGGGLDLGSLPDDFPTELLPEIYDTGGAADLGGGSTTVGVESTVPVDDTIEYYRSLLGEPESEIEGDPGEKIVQWPPDDDGWIVSVIGSPDESITSITRFVD